MRHRLLVVLLPIAVAAVCLPGVAAAASAPPTHRASVAAGKTALADEIAGWRQAALAHPIAAKPWSPAGSTASTTARTTMVAPSVTTECGSRNPVPPPPGGAPYETWSRYIAAGATDLYQMGFDQGCASDQQRGTSSSLSQIAILDFKDPGRGGDGSYGAWRQGVYYPIGSVSQPNSIEWSVMRYMLGFWQGTVPGSGSFMTVLVGVNNHKYNSNGSDNGAPVNYAHGRAWATMVNDLNAWISSAGMGTQLLVEAANDMETSWALYSQTLDWANGFTSVGRAKYYDFGDAGGCPTSGFGECVAGPVNGGHMGWSTANEYTLAWGLTPAFAIPEIYYSYQAQQWYLISLQGVTSGGSRIYFTAALSQHNACGCSNTYDQSWSQLQNAVNGDSRTSIGRIPFATEMSYTNP